MIIKAWLRFSIVLTFSLFSIASFSSTEVLFDSPRSDDYTIDNETISMIDSVQSGGEILGAFYFIYDIKTILNGKERSLRSTLIKALERGVHIHIITESNVYGKAKALDGLDIYPNFKHTTCNGGCIYGPSDSSFIMHNKLWITRKSENDGYYLSLSSHNYSASQQKMHQQAVIFKEDKDKYDLFKDYFYDLIKYKDKRVQNYYKSVKMDDVRFYFFPRKDGDLILEILNNVSPDKGDCNINITMSSWTTGRQKVIDRLKRLSVDGCNVSTIINTKAGKQTIAAFYNSGINGVHHNVKVIKNDKPHSKYMLIDAFYNGKRQKLTWSGSHNFTGNALTYNDETLVKTYDAHIYHQFLSNWTSILSCETSLIQMKMGVALSLLQTSNHGENVPPDAANNEWVDFSVTGPKCINLSGWKLEDGYGNYTVFPKNTIVDSGHSLRVYSGCNNFQADLRWKPNDHSRSILFGGMNKTAPCSGVWNNKGNTITLKDKYGYVIKRHRY